MQAAKPYHHGRLREALVDAAFGLARTGGPAAVVLRAVSREAGVSHNAAYRHFADHEELLAAVAERCMRALADLMARRSAEVTEPDPVAGAWARMEAIGRAYVEFATTEPGWFRTAFGAAKPPPGPHGAAPESTGIAGPEPGAATAAQAEAGPYELLGARLDELVAAGAIPAARRPGAEFAAWSLVHGLSSLLVDGPLRTLAPAEAAAALDVVMAEARRGL